LPPLGTGGRPAAAVAVETDLGAREEPVKSQPGETDQTPGIVGS